MMKAGRYKGYGQTTHYVRRGVDGTSTNERGDSVTIRGVAALAQRRIPEPGSNPDRVAPSTPSGSEG
jgi:hypothetical protein